jgi:DNA invertase Pin-like site-specific DNA recombinase
MTTVGYARVSTDGQTLDAQQAALADAGCAKVFAEKQSGAKTHRAQLAKAIATLTAGDTLVVCKLDRLARSTRDLLNTLAAIADAGASFRSLGDPWCDTTSAHGKLMVTVLGGLAEFERHLILARTTEGRKRAQARGVRFGRKLKLCKASHRINAVSTATHNVCSFYSGCRLMAACVLAMRPRRARPTAFSAKTSVSAFVNSWHSAEMFASGVMLLSD